MKHLRANEIRLALAAFLLLFLLAAAVNVPVAVMLTTARLTPLKVTLNISGPEAAAKGWPVAPPHAQAWPEPSQWAVQSAWLGHRRLIVSNADAGANTHQMQIDESGWPLPALRTVQMWWPWNDPAWATTAQPDPGMTLAWPGLLLNPLIVGGGLWLPLVALPLLVVVLGRARRARRGLCVHCGYPVGTSTLCTECGRSLAA